MRTKSSSHRDVRSAPGFRFWWTDAVVIAFVAIATWVCWRYSREISLLFAITLFHFFLFCNVFRLRRKLELIWAVFFVVIVAAWSLAGHLSWWYILTSQLPVTLGVIVTEIRSDGYHGIFWRRSNDV